MSGISVCIGGISPNSSSHGLRSRFQLSRGHGHCGKTETSRVVLQRVADGESHERAARRLMPKRVSFEKERN